MGKFLCLFLAVFMMISCKKTDSDQPTQQPVVIYQDNLTVDKGTWPVDSTSIHVKKFQGGHYLIEVDSVPNVISFSLAPCDSINFSYSMQADVTVEYDTSRTTAIAGMIFNWTNHGNYFVVELTSKGNYRIWERIDGSISTFQSPTFSAAIHTGNLARNTIKLIQSAETMELIINGTSVGTFDIWLPDVFFKVGLSTSTGQAPVKGLFNNFILEKL
jgi:hypothetical protein